MTNTDRRYRADAPAVRQIVARYTFEDSAAASVRARNIEAGADAFALEYDAPTDTWTVVETAPRPKTRVARIAGRTIRQTFDSHGECEHRAFSKAFGRPEIIWSTRDECVFCGTGREEV